MVEYIVEYDYDAVNEDELTIRVGDIIKNVNKLEEDGWLEGEVNGKRGAFPDNFVKEIKKDPEPKEENVSSKREKSGNVASLVQRMSVYGIPGMGPPPQPKSIKKKSKKRQCKVLYEYVPQNEDELELNVGEILDVIEEVEEGWWRGSNSGKSGLFPSNFVKELELSDDGESQESTEDSEQSVTTPIATPASPVPSPVNGPDASPLATAQPKRVMGVGFGDIFKEGSVKLKTRMPAPEPEVKKPEKPVPVQPSGSIKVLRSASSDASRTETDNKPKAKEMCRALFNYESVNDDELSFKEGDIICLTSKDTGDPGWWKGEFNGKEGVFPDNFVAIIQDSEKEKPRKPPPPIKSPAPKPELRIGEKKLTPTKTEEKDEKPLLDLKPPKPAAPQVPPKKPSLVSKSNSLLKPAVIPPKRPEKPAFPSPTSKPNGDLLLIRPKPESETLNKAKTELDQQVLSRPKSTEAELHNKAKTDLEQILSRPKSEVEPHSKTKTDLEQILNKPKSEAEPLNKTKMDLEQILSRPKSNGEQHNKTKMDLEHILSRTKSVEVEPAAKSPRDEVDFFGDVIPTSNHLSHPTANRPKMQGKRLPGRFNGPNAQSKDLTDSVKVLKEEENESAKVKTPEVKKPLAPSIGTSPLPTSFPVSKPAPSPPVPLPTEAKVKSDVTDSKRSEKSEMDDLKAQISDLLSIVHALRKEHRKEMDHLKKQLDEERLLRTHLETEVDKLKKAVQLT
ncbi:CD2-associated protein L homeolog [Xenopus laevis]|uniref:CD2-associated protein L homeolog n=1 Tax=Xenopus laevis TaxID=8355 RepID=Q4V7X8_XENLA|nr:CD2-associated protein L homeolog [Xenopus laevis]AAH97671.1 LOC445851 protein [Xenopus laevis]